MNTDLDTLLIALYVELDDGIIPSRGPRTGPGHPLEVTDAELVCLAVAQVLLRYDDERHWLRSAPALVGHLFPRLLSQSEYNRRLRAVGGLLEEALRRLAARTPSSADAVRLWDGTPVPCGASRETAKRSDLAGWAGYGMDKSHHRFYWGAELMLCCAPDGLVTGFILVNPKLVKERDAIRTMFALEKNRPEPGTTGVCDKGFAGAGFGADMSTLGITVIRPARKDETDPGIFPQWLRQRIESVNWTLKSQLGLEAHGGRVLSGLWARVLQRLLALNAAIWHNWACGAERKRSLIHYDHPTPLTST
ncbi:IS982 family transposase [Streptomyces iconiensis]|uniref:IS982 family transposase n=1 Tax=Streptomyces iconiensis TaxID=1384038 RepID=A0ABT7A686_9ACTN|nr:IS982 family transposase [Streptomyces iconiensis]MDJ1136849.1 IS982 family transposase [Streptomyces iconiensis]